MRQLWVLLVFLSCFGAAGASELTLQDRTVVSQADDRSKAPMASPGDTGRTVALLLAVPESRRCRNWRARTLPSMSRVCVE